MELINRYAVVVRPAQPMIDWVRQVDIDMGNEPLADEAIRSNTNVYLIPEFEPPADAEKYLRKRVKGIFEEELAGWYTVPDLWPKQRGWKTFCKWMEWDVHEMVWDMEAGAIVKESFDEPAGEGFDFNEDLYDEEEGLIDGERAHEWAEALYEWFEESPEAEEFRKAHPNEYLGWPRSFFEYIHHYESMTIHEARAENVEYALMSHFPRKVLDPELNAEATIDEFRALFAFLGREYGLEHADEIGEYLETEGLAEEFEAAMNNSSAFGMAKSFFSGGGFSGGPFGGGQTPYQGTEPDVGRNDPCPCGSGRKYKKCCLQRD